ncbi:MAG: ATP-binding cassette domain-containing protein [Candidatus Altiarchaeota archaeon]|nr:ATP-binding cassette domain-containing protein [Candidatus Altiarchaeota archaeon]
MPEVVSIHNLSKRFNGLAAVDGISFSVEEGEIFGFLGPNGAGKTTTLSMLSTLLEPSSGGATVNGYDIKTDRDNVRKSIGIVFQDPSLDEELTAYENMDFHGWLYNVPREVRKKKIPELLKLVELDDRQGHFVKTFSGGMKRRLEIARGLLHEPKVLFLDEPTLGLDPQTRNHIWDYIRQLNKEKHTTIILTTHYMEEADRLCNRVAIIDHGRIIALGTSDELKETIGGDVITLESPDGGRLMPVIEKMPWLSSAKEHDGVITLNVSEANRNVIELMNLLHENKISITSLKIHNPTLEDVFLYYTGKTIREREADTNEAMRMRHRMFTRR